MNFFGQGHSTMSNAFQVSIKNGGWDFIYSCLNLLTTVITLLILPSTLSSNNLISTDLANDHIFLPTFMIYIPQ